MKFLKALFSFLLCFFCLCQLSCVKVPLEITLDRPIRIKEKDVAQATKDIQDRLISYSLADPDHNFGPGKIDPDECNNYFNAWVDQQFSKKLMPKRMVTPLEYASNSNNPLIGQCKSVDLGIEYSKAAQEALVGSVNRINYQRFGLKKLQDAFNSEACAKSYLDPEKKKLIIKNYYTNIEINTLNYPTPRFTMFYSTREVNDGEIKNMDDITELQNNGDFKVLGHVDPLPLFTKGIVAIDTSSDEAGAAQNVLSTENADIFGVGDIIGRDPTTTKVGEREYYVIPSGELAFHIKVDVEIKGEIGDAVCALNEYKRKMKEEDDERRKNSNR